MDFFGSFLLNKWVPWFFSVYNKINYMMLVLLITGMCFFCFISLVDWISFILMIILIFITDNNFFLSILFCFWNLNLTLIVIFYTVIDYKNVSHGSKKYRGGKLKLKLLQGSRIFISIAYVFRPTNFLLYNIFDCLEIF